MAEISARARIGLILAPRAAKADGIRDYAHRLLRALREAALAAELLEWTGGAPEALAARELDALVVQYNPFSFGRWGFAPRLPLFLAGLHRIQRRPRIAVMFHETYVDMRSFSWTLMGAWQRAQLIGVQASADVQLCSIQRWTERLRKTSFGRPVHHLPVASNLPDARAHRDRTRRRIGAGAGTVVLGCVGLDHPGRLREHVLAAAGQAGSVARAVLLLDLGPGQPSLRPLAENVCLYRTGFLREDDLAGHLAASDVFMAPYADGISTRRSSVMAALANAVPVVGTVGHLTDDVLRDAPALTLIGRESPHRFADAVTGLVEDPGRRAELGGAGRRLYDSSFDWPVLVSRLRRHLDV